MIIKLEEIEKLKKYARKKKSYKLLSEISYIENELSQEGEVEKIRMDDYCLSISILISLCKDDEDLKKCVNFLTNHVRKLRLRILIKKYDRELKRRKLRAKKKKKRKLRAKKKKRTKKRKTRPKR